MKGIMRVAITFTVVMIVFTVMFGCGDTEEQSPAGEIEGIYAADIEVTYDGRSHGIDLMGVVESDRIFYSATGAEWSENELKYTDAGEYTVWYKVERSGFKEYISNAKIKIDKAIIQGISAKKKIVVYDGAPHGIEIEGAEDHDDVQYSDDGIAFKTSVTKVEVGRYRIYYSVERKNEEYRGSAELVILPEIRGRYWNREKGEVEINDTEYDETGKGEWYEVKDGVMTVDGVQFEKLADGKEVYEISVNGESVYIAGDKSGDKIEICIDEATSTAEVKYNGEVIKRVDGVNHSVSGEEIALSEKRTEVELTLLPVSEIESVYTLVVYDGQEHGHDIPAGWACDKSPKYVAVGRYTDKISISKTGYKDKEITAVLEIAEDLSGIYCTERDIIEINKDCAKKNGQEISMQYNDGQWEIAGKRTQRTSGGISCDGEDFAKANGHAVRLEIGEESTVITEDGDLVITAKSDGYTIEFGGEVLVEKSGRVTGVGVNGQEESGIPDETGTMYIVGLDEMQGAVFVQITVEQSELKNDFIRN